MGFLLVISWVIWVIQWDIDGISALWETYKKLLNMTHLYWIYPIKTVIYHSFWYVYQRVFGISMGCL